MNLIKDQVHKTSHKQKIHSYALKFKVNCLEELTNFMCTKIPRATI